MAAKCFLVLCASVCFVKVISAQCIGSINNIAGSALAEELALSGNMLANRAGFGAYGQVPGYAAAGYGLQAGYGFNSAPSSGGGFPVTSISPISPTGISVVSENTIEGPILITGQLPFLGAIAVEGALPTAGAGVINYGCGGGAVGIVTEGLAPAAYPAGPGYGAAGLAPAAYPAGPGYGAAGLASGRGYPGLAGPRPCGLGAGFGYGPIY